MVNYFFEFKEGPEVPRDWRPNGDPLLPPQCHPGGAGQGDCGLRQPPHLHSGGSAGYFLTQAMLRRHQPLRPCVETRRYGGGSWQEAASGPGESERAAGG